MRNSHKLFALALVSVAGVAHAEVSQPTAIIDRPRTLPDGEFEGSLSLGFGREASPCLHPAAPDGYLLALGQSCRRPVSRMTRRPCRRRDIPQPAALLRLARSTFTPGPIVELTATFFT